jgi:hypothetical protein
MKVSELTGSELDYWVAKAQGWEKKTFIRGGLVYWSNGVTSSINIESYTPTTNWQQCGELIEKFKLVISQNGDDWTAQVNKPRPPTAKPYSAKSYLGPIGYGSTPQEAICRAVVASVFGDTVPDKGE